MSDYERYFDKLQTEAPFQVLVIKRYDNDGGIWAAQTMTWPAERLDRPGFKYSSYPKTLGFLKDHEAFRAELVARGFVKYGFATLPMDEIKYITDLIVPLEWKRGMEVFGVRVDVYNKEA